MSGDYNFSCSPAIGVTPKKEVSAGVLLGPHNQDMERFLIFRQPLVEAEASPGNALPGAREEEGAREAQTETSSNLGALLVILAPFAVAAWAAIGFFVYRLIA